MRFIFIFLVVLGGLLSGPQRTYAQATVAMPDGTEITLEEYIRRFEIPEGRVNELQASIIARREIPGEIVKRAAYEDDGDFFYEFDILQRNNSLFAVKISGDNGSVVNTRILRLGQNAEPPAAEISKEEAINIATGRVQEKSYLRNKEPKLLNSDYRIYQQKMVYVIKMEKVLREYTAIIDANSGEILKFEEE